MTRNIEYYIDQIEDFLLKKLSDSDRHEFIEAMKQYPVLKDEVALRQLEFETAEEIIADNIRNQFNNLRTQNLDTPLKSKSKTTRNWIFLGIAILLCLGIIYLTRSKSTSEPGESKPIPNESPANTPDSNEDTSGMNSTPPLPPERIQGKKSPMITQRELDVKRNSDVQETPAEQRVNNKKRLMLASMLFKDPVIDVLRSDKSQQEDPFYIANTEWTANNVTKAYLALKKVDSNDKRYIYAQLLSGHACFRLRRFQQAEIHYKYVLNMNKMPYVEDAEWHLLLTYLAMGKSNTPEFNKLLSKLVKDTGHSFNEEAKLLDNELKQEYIKK